MCLLKILQYIKSKRFCFRPSTWIKYKTKTHTGQNSDHCKRQTRNRRQAAPIAGNGYAHDSGRGKPRFINIKKQHTALQICRALYTDTEQSCGALLGKEEFTNTLTE